MSDEAADEQELDEFEEEDLDAEEELDEHHLQHALESLPLMDDPVLAMQARNIVIVDHHLREWERDILLLHIQEERTPVPQLLTLSAFSQQWVFAFYELLRTWRQWCKELLKFRRELDALPDGERAGYLAAKQSAISGPEGREGLMTGSARKRLEQAANSDLPDEIGRALVLTEEPWRRLEGLRVSLAKLEIPKSRGAPDLTPSLIPGYSRQNMLNGSLTWPIELKDGFTDLISRTELREDFALALLRDQTDAE